MNHMLVEKFGRGDYCDTNLKINSFYERNVGLRGMNCCVTSLLVTRRVKLERKERVEA